MRDDPQQTVQRFSDCINARDLAGLDSLMTENHSFIDSTNEMLRGKAAALAAWREFFQLFPDYQNVFERMTTVEVPRLRINACSVASRSG
jgi:ketosteroid isomerase-like protein